MTNESLLKIWILNAAISQLHCSAIVPVQDIMLDVQDIMLHVGGIIFDVIMIHFYQIPYKN